MEITFNRYEYPIEDENGIDVASYTIKEGISPLKYKDEKLVQTFTATIYSKKEWNDIVSSLREY